MPLISSAPADSAPAVERFRYNLARELLNVLLTDYDEGFHDVDDATSLLENLSILTGIPVDLMVAGHALAFDLAEVAWGGEWSKPVTVESNPNDPKLSGDIFSSVFYPDEDGPVMADTFARLLKPMGDS